MKVSPLMIRQRRWAQAAQYELRSHGNISVVTSEQGGVAVFQLLPKAIGLNNCFPDEPVICRSFISLESKFPHRPHTWFYKK